jgi:hypothetical protein
MRLKIIASLTCIILAGLHITFPTFAVDNVTLFFLIAAGLLWLGPLIKSLELPGGFKIELQDVKTATDKVSAGTSEREGTEAVTSTPIVSIEEESAIERLRNLADSDPNLALVGLRIEIETRLAKLARAEGISTESRTVGWLLRELKQRKKLTPATASGLNELVSLGNRAAHGTDVTRDAAEWAIDTAPTILGMIEAPHVAFIKLWDELDKVVIACTAVEFQSLWPQKDFRTVLSRLEERRLISSSERAELDDLHALRWDVRVGFGSWYKEATDRMARLEQLIELLKRRCKSGEALADPA